MIGWKPKSPDARVASVRIRCLNPLGELQRRGFPVELFQAARSATYRAVVYSKLYDEASYCEASRLQAAGVRIIVDLCDNHFYNPSGDPVLQRAGAHLRRMLDMADQIVVSTSELAGIVRNELSGDRPLTLIGDAVEDRIEGVKQSPLRTWYHRRQLRRLLSWQEHGRRSGIEASLVWFGIHGGPHHEHGMGDLRRVQSLLESLHREHPLQLTVISNSRPKFDRIFEHWSLPVRYLEWNPATFLPALRAHHIALIPVTSNPFTRCKSNNRLATALAAGLAVVADSIPSYRPFAAVCRLDRWQEGLAEYVTDEAVRRSDVRAGQELVRRDCALPRIADDWQKLFQTVMGDPVSMDRLETAAN
jgi:hypothetical protein